MRLSQRNALLLCRITALGIVIFTSPFIGAQCAGVSEEGRWRNLEANGDPLFIDVKMTGGCGDEVLNGEQSGTSTRYSIRVWVKQSTGKLYGRPAVRAAYKTWNGKSWLRGDVYTGGYQDQMWLHVEPHDGKSQLRVLIRHQSLDSKPSSQTNYWFVK